MLYAYSLIGHNTERNGTTHDRDWIIDDLGAEIFAKGKDWDLEAAKSQVAAAIEKAESDQSEVTKEMVKQYAKARVGDCQPWYHLSIAVLHP